MIATLLALISVYDTWAFMIWTALTRVVRRSDHYLVQANVCFGSLQEIRYCDSVDTAPSKLMKASIQPRRWRELPFERQQPSLLQEYAAFFDGATNHVRACVFRVWIRATHLPHCGCVCILWLCSSRCCTDARCTVNHNRPEHLQMV